jgi:dTDP-glucose 4,6-dehydratase
MVQHVPDRKGHDRRYALDDSLLRGLGYAPRVGFGQGLAATMRWYQENRHWWQPLKQAHRDGAAGHTARGRDGRRR